MGKEFENINYKENDFPIYYENEINFPLQFFKPTINAATSKRFPWIIIFLVYKFQLSFSIVSYNLYASSV